MPLYPPAASSGAPTDATYLTQVANSSLSAEQAMGSLATGLVKNTTTTGVQSIATAGVDYVSPAAHNLPEGTILNGRISPSVSSNNITLALKGMDGNDPSSSNPVYIRLNSTIRAVTAALSVTKNAGTNWMNLGSTAHATFEHDLFAYLGYNATDGVVIGFSRLAHARQYSDFSTTTTNAAYAAISTITNAASTDYYHVIGRFAATLSATASFNWSVPTYTAINLIQRPIYESRWLTYNPVRAVSGGTTPTYTAFDVSKYKIRENAYRLFYHWNNESGGTAGSGANNLAFEVPFPYLSTLYGDDRGILALGEFYESAGTICAASVHADNLVSTTAVRLKNVTTQANLSGNDQSSTQRWIGLQGEYEV